MRRKTHGAPSSHMPSQPEVTDPTVEAARQAARLLLSPEEAGNRMQLSRATIYRMLERGELRSIKIGAVRRIPVRELEAYIAAHLPDGSLTPAAS